MMRLVAFSFGVFLAASLRAQEELPKDPVESFDIEPPLLNQNIGLPNSGKSTAASDSQKELDPEQIRVAVEKAKKSAAAGERLFKSGVLAKVEAENRAMKVIRLETDLAEARLETAIQALAAQQSRFDAGEISQSDLEIAKSALVAATNEAQAAVATRDRAELDAALLNLHRQQKLLALGSGRKSEVSRAQEKVAALQQQKN
jgi:hypothetical protein